MFHITCWWCLAYKSYFAPSASRALCYIVNPIMINIFNSRNGLQCSGEVESSFVLTYHQNISICLLLASHQCQLFAFVLWVSEGRLLLYIKFLSRSEDWFTHCCHLASSLLTVISYFWTEGKDKKKIWKLTMNFQQLSVLVSNYRFIPWPAYEV